ncbi:alpha-1-antitrypsin-like [Leptodactylus fuscus]|uniref:alpha-1-antitrypsin-like n=1 Tax=Leptodactylus fuscus TaxID=238119 RepID=UPI003F4EF70A
MRVILFLGVAVIFALAFADGKHKHDKDDDKGGHRKKRETRGKNPPHPQKESLSYHKLQAPSTSNFSFDLYRRFALGHASENIVLSPASIPNALGLLLLATRGRSKSQIIQGLGYNTSEVSEQEIHPHLQNLLSGAESDLQLSSGNALFVSKKLKILQSFLEEAKRLHHSEVFSTDFKNEDEAKNQINSYVEKKSNGQITDLMDGVDQGASFVLVNYIYFRGQWEHPFNENHTKDGDFHVNENKTVKVPYMSRTGTYNMAETNEATMVSVPYKGGVSALIIQPKNGKMSEIEQKINKESIQKWKKIMKNRFVQLNLPKFSISATVNLKETFIRIGMVDVFSNNADLSGVTGEANRRMSKTIHRAVLSVDETGTEGAPSAASEATPAMPPLYIEVNRPFLILITKNKPESVFFIGRILNPQK